MKMIFWAFFVVLVVHLNIGCADGSTVAKVNLVLTVVDDEGKPVDEVKVSGGGWIPGKYRAALVDGITNKQGEFKTSFKSAVDFGFFFDKEGYYKSQMHYYLTAETVPKIEKGYWQPNPIKETVVLKRVKNPVPMYAKNVYKVKIPTLGKPLGYDLIAGDWAAPYGKGTVADFIINATGTVRDNLAKEVHMTVTFSNAKDGIQSFKSLPIHNGFPLGSAFWSSHEAPIDGYEPVYKYESILTPEAEGRKNPGQRMDQNFYFRVRSQVDEKGNVKKAMYGKIYADFCCRFSGDKDIEVTFMYYLNPDWTRNMEFDKKQNLFKGLGYLEEVKYP